MKRRLQFGNRTIEFRLYHQERKSMTIRVHPDQTVEVLAPLEADEATVRTKLLKKTPWILKQLDFFSAYKPATPPRRFVNGETHLYLGRQYRLKIVPDEEDSVKAYRGQLWMHAVNTAPDALKKQLNRWYQEKAALVFNELLEEVLPRFNRYKIDRPQLSIRFMTKRWGSCTPAGRIILNTELVKAPKGSIEYVIVHELSHLVYYNHAKEFLALQTRMLPDWEKWKAKLEHMLA